MSEEPTEPAVPITSGDPLGTPAPTPPEGGGTPPAGGSGPGGAGGSGPGGPGGSGPERPADPPPGPGAPGVRRLTRSTTDRVIGGVAGGLGRHLGIDPIIVRVAFVLLMFAGGAGALAYLALLAFVPSDDGVPLGGGSSRAASVAAITALVVGALVFLGLQPPALGGLAVLAVIGLFAVLAVRALGGADDPGRTAVKAALLVLGLLAGLAAAVGVGLVAALGGSVTIAVLAIVTGLVLAATAFVGGARWLIVPALVLALPLAVVSAADLKFEGGAGQRVYRPSDVSQLRSPYKLGIGELVVDLRNVSLPAGRTDVAVDVGLGQATVQVPAGVCVTSDVRMGAGNADVFGKVDDGIDIAVSQGGTPQPGQPELHVKAHVGTGDLVVGTGTPAGWMAYAPLDTAALSAAGCA